MGFWRFAGSTRQRHPRRPGASLGWPPKRGPSVRRRKFAMISTCGVRRTGRPARPALFHSRPRIGRGIARKGLGITGHGNDKRRQRLREQGRFRPARGDEDDRVIVRPPGRARGRSRGETATAANLDARGVCKASSAFKIKRIDGCEPAIRRANVLMPERSRIRLAPATCANPATRASSPPGHPQTSRRYATSLATASTASSAITIEPWFERRARSWSEAIR